MVILVSVLRKKGTKEEDGIKEECRKLIETIPTNIEVENCHGKL